jgi:hypothetical protein
MDSEGESFYINYAGDVRQRGSPNNFIVAHTEVMSGEGGAENLSRERLGGGLV